MTHTIVGIFDSRDEAQDAMRKLVKDGFITEDIDISNRRKITDTEAVKAARGNDDIGDSISSFFSNLFSDDDYTATNFSTVARETEAIVTVQSDSQDRANKAAKILDDCGAIDVEERAAKHREQYARTNQRNDDDGKMTIPVVEENLEVGKRAVETGGVKVRSRIVEKPVEEKLRLREEHVVVDRRPVDRAATEADFNNFKEGSIEITEHAEKAVVGKEARVVGEVAVGKTVEEHEKTISDTVRKTEVDVDKIDGEARRATNRS